MQKVHICVVKLSEIRNHSALLVLDICFLEMKIENFKNSAVKKISCFNHNINVTEKITKHLLQNMDYNFSKSNETVSFPEGAMSMLYAILLILLILLNFSCQFKFFIGFICLLILSLVTNILAANDL